jgi:diaminopimelate epimerase
MRFEKWQALGNDYLIVEGPTDAELVRLLCDRHVGVGADGVLALEDSDEAGFVARLRIFNPDGSEAELSGNGARQALMYLHRHGRAPGRQFSIQTIAGEIRATVLDDRTCRVDMGRAKDLGEGHVAGYAFRRLEVGNPQAAIRIEDAGTLDALDLKAIGPPVENDPQFPNRTNVSFWTELAPDRIRARIFERGVGETMSSGTGATGAALAHVLRGGDSPVTVVLDGGELIVDIDEALHVDLTGWAIPVFTGELANVGGRPLEGPASDVRGVSGACGAWRGRFGGRGAWRARCACLVSR